MTANVGPDQARRDAAHIIAKYPKPTINKPWKLWGPLRSVLNFIGRNILAPIGHAIGSVWSFLFGSLPVVAQVIVAIAIAVAVVVFIALTAQSRAQQRAKQPDSLPNRIDEGQQLSADRLEALALEAEQTGDYARAIRYRFRAGILRLQHDLDVLDKRPGLTTHEARGALQSTRFNNLANTFEYVTYANSPAHESDAATARSEWPAVLAECAHD